MPDELLLSPTGLNHLFGQAETRKQANFDVTMQIKRGSLTVLQGPSGSDRITVLTLMGWHRDVQDGLVQLLAARTARGEPGALGKGAAAFGLHLSG